MIRYRPNVAAILQNSDGHILICERSDIPGAWQFPQGGVDPGETDIQALEREMMEELSLSPGDYKVISKKGKYRYLIGEGKTKKGFHGQEQEYFLLQLLSAENAINLEEPAQFDLRWLPAMKRDVYREVMNDFFGVGIGNEPA